MDYRVANIRAGYVYVISNVGSFGDSVIKVGMTRRQDPRDRVRELSDASVPFNFDVHALFFSADAVGIETKMHQLLADRRVNRVNRRREFFYATASEARAHLLALTGEMLEFTELPEAVEYQGARTKPPPCSGRARVGIRHRTRQTPSWSSSKAAVVPGFAALAQCLVFRYD